MTAGKKRRKTIPLLCGLAVFAGMAFLAGCGKSSSKKTEAPAIKPGQKIVTVSLSGGVELKLARVGAGSFEMSAGDGTNDSDEVAHPAVLKRDFYIGKTEVTQAQWKAVMGTNPSKFRGKDLPVENVSWNDAMEFCESLNDAGNAPDGWIFTLPTETQWEYAARGGEDGTVGRKYSGDDRVEKVAWYYENSRSRTRPVGRKKANELGLHDMCGNVWEWCLDDWRKKSDSLTAEFTKVDYQKGSSRVIRGGSWFGSARRCRIANRSHSSPDYRDDRLGFRVALVPVE